MLPDVERIIESIIQGDQDNVQLQLHSYNTQYADCFFFDTEVQERKKQQELEEFRKNKVRDYSPDSESDIDSDGEEPDLLLRQRLATALLCFITGQLQPSVLWVCLHTLRILSRDRRGLGPLVTESTLVTLAGLGGIGLLQAPPQQQEERAADQPAMIHTQIQRGAASGPEEAADTDAPPSAGSSVVSSAGAAACDTTTNGGPCNDWRADGSHVVLTRGKRETREDSTEGDEMGEDGEVCRKEALKILCNVIYNSPRAQEKASDLRLLQGLWESLKQEIRSREPSGGQFYRLRLLFLLTALRPELRLQLRQEHGVSVLTQALERCLAVRWGVGYEVLSDKIAAPISKETSQEVIEILKTLFNIAHRINRQEPDEEEAEIYRHLAAVLRHCLLMACNGEDTMEELQGHTVNILSVLPLTCLDVLLSVPVDKASHKWGGVNMDCVQALLLLMDRRLNRGVKLKEKLTPVLNLLTESCRVHRETRHYLRQKILPPLRNVATRPEQETTLRGQLVRLMTHVDTVVKHCAAELLFVLCKENVSRFVKYTGYGNAAGLLAARGLLHGRRNSGDSQYEVQYSSDSDSDTEEYREAKARINLVTGRVETEQPDPMEGMTEEEKEEEALNLISMINRLSQDQIFQPMGVTTEGRLAPLWGQMKDCTLEEEEEEEENEEDAMDLLPEGTKDKE